MCPNRCPLINAIEDVRESRVERLDELDTKC